MNKRKTVSNIIDFFVSFELIIVICNIIFKIISLFVLKKDTVYLILSIFCVILTLILIPIIKKKDNTYGKYIAKKLVKNKYEKVNIKDILLVFIILSILCVIVR